MMCQLYQENNANKIIAYRKPNTGMHKIQHSRTILLHHSMKSYLVYVNALAEMQQL